MSISRIIEKVKTGQYTKKDLINLYENSQRVKNVPKGDKELLIAEIEYDLRNRFPTAATCIFGAKDAIAREILLNLYKKVANEFDLSKNTLKNGVKTGGRMLTGEAHIDVYISYKNIELQAACVVFSQEKADSELSASIIRYQTIGNKTTFLDKKQINNLTDTAEIFNKYKDALQEVINL